jgi:hypothetical protein
MVCHDVCCCENPAQEAIFPANFSETDAAQRTTGLHKTGLDKTEKISRW